MVLTAKPLKTRIKEVLFFEILLAFIFMFCLGAGNALRWLAKLALESDILLVGWFGVLLAFGGLITTLVAYTFGVMVIIPMILVLINMDVDSRWY